jgi:hypothetical protein
VKVSSEFGGKIVQEQDIERIKAIIQTMGERYQVKGGDVQLAGIEAGTVKISPAGFCWR